MSFEVRPGEVFGLMGPNGSGKSTLLRVLSTAIAPESGTFRIGDVNGLEEQQEARAKMGLMVDRPTHYGDLSGWANAYLFARSYGMEEGKAQSVLAELFDYFGLAEYGDDRAKTYSYGMGKKLALIEAMAHGPELLLLDEPSLGSIHLAARLPAKIRCSPPRRRRRRREQPWWTSRSHVRSRRVPCIGGSSWRSGRRELRLPLEGTRVSLQLCATRSSTAH